MNGIENHGGVIKQLGIESPAPNKSRIEFHEITVQGNLPSPEDLEKYERVLTGAAERLLTLVENEQKFRHEQTLIALENENHDMNVSINAGKTRMKITGQGLVILAIIIVLLSAVIVATLFFNAPFFTGAGFVLLTWLLVSLRFLRLKFRNPQDDSAKE